MADDPLDRSDKVFFQRKSDRRCRLIILATAAIAMLVIGILIGRFGTCPDPPGPEPRQGPYLPNVPAQLMRDEDVSVIDEIMNAIDAEKIRENLR